MKPPARAFVTSVQSHTGKRSCPKCCQIGNYFQKRVCFSKKIHDLRTDISFKNRSDIEHHNVKFRDQQNILERTNFGMVSQFPIDPMHLVDLGVTKKLLRLIQKKANVTEMNNKLNYISKLLPSDFGRVCISFDEFNNFKSSEYRQFLLYSGIFVLRDCIDEDLYYHFLLLHAGIRLLSQDQSFKSEGRVAQALLEEFVKLFGELY